MNASRIQTLTQTTPRLDESALVVFAMMVGVTVSYALFFNPGLGSAISVNPIFRLCGSLLVGVAACRSLCRQKVTYPR